jgi:hypothetical protein
MDKITLVILTALVCIPLTALILLRVKSKPRPFRPLYTRRESVLSIEEQNDYVKLDPHLERAGMRLLPCVGLQQIAAIKKGLPPAESSRAFMELDGRTVQFLLIETKRLTPLAVVHIGGDGSAQQFPEWLQSGAKFCSALFESVGVPEIVVLDKDMKDPERVVCRIQEVMQGGKAGVLYI